MRTTTATALAALLGVALLGCDVEEQEPGIQPAAEEERALDTADTATSGDDSTIGVDSLDDGGEYITDGEGRALYAIEGEPEDQSTCYDQCAQEWPPLLVADGEPTAGADPGAGVGADAGAVRADLIGTLERQDGDRQATYAGRALYYYHDDQGPGQTEGQDVTDQWGEWYLIQPSGELLEDHEEGESSEAQS